MCKRNEMRHGKLFWDAEILIAALYVHLDFGIESTFEHICYDFALDLFNIGIKISSGRQQ